MAVKRKPAYLTLAEKVSLIKQVERNPKKKHSIAIKFGLTKSALTGLLKAKCTVLNNFQLFGAGAKSVEPKTTPKAAAARLCGKDESRTKTVPSDETCGKLSKRFVQKNLTFSLDGQTESSLVPIRKNSEVGSTPVQIASVLDDYCPSDIFAAFEFGLFYKCLPDEAAALRGQQCEDGSRSRERVTILICANFKGDEKLKPLVVGFEDTAPGCYERLPVTYGVDERAWMTDSLFERWLTDLDRKMQAEKRKILLLINGPGQACPVPELRAVNVRFSHGRSRGRNIVVRHFKTAYRKEVVRQIVRQRGRSPAIDLDQALRYIAKSWRAVAPKTIRECLRSTWSDNPAGDGNERHSLWSAIVKKYHLNIRETFGAYVQVDDDLAVRLTNVTRVRECSPRDVGVDTLESGKNTTTSVLGALDTLKRFIQLNKGISSSYFEALAALENVINDNVKRKRSKENLQTTITDFFVLNKTL
ncbi:tigger transposable element-derived protein 6-like [Adelges cooleyi]|uniref:tigger transposable element-derived protein 6-like n=1 Tax=Adelges cooleyi TaxID=133065 RepID=UPI00217F795E|nr:tigger transposable element-derived protein 6-like [Adelges cooleyi]